MICEKVRCLSKSLKPYKKNYVSMLFKKMPNGKITTLTFKLTNLKIFV